VNKNASGSSIFQNLRAEFFFMGLRKGKAEMISMLNPMMHTTRASNLSPKRNAEPEKAFPGGLYDQKKTNLARDIMPSQIITTANIQRNSRGNLLKSGMLILI
jgi:hypothetical protein